MLTALSLLGGLALLVVGGEMLARGSVRVAERFAVSPLLIGLTLVGFGTSTPALVTSVQAALVGSPGIAVGNIVGSNIANVLVILDASAVIFPLAVHARALRREGTFVTALIAPTPLPRSIAWFDSPVMIAASLLVVVFALSGRRLSRGEGDVRLALYAACAAWLVGHSHA